jgi:hypothetical protein
MRCGEISDRRKYYERKKKARQEALVDRAVNVLLIVRTRETRNKNAHSDKDRRNKNDDDKKYLKAYADRGVRLVTEQVPDHNMIDPALDAADDICENCGPSDLPNGACERAFDYGTVEFSRSCIRCGRRRGWFR